MRVISGPSNVHTLLNMYGTVMRSQERAPRGLRTKNVRNMAVQLDGRWSVLTSFRARNFNLNYAKQEWLWYLRADKFDDSIEQHATMWKKLKQADGSYYSNYGQYMFGHRDYHHVSSQPSQFEYCADQLLKDPDTRRASMTLLQPYHLYDGNTDLVCTYAINFTIEDNVLHMTVMMRSNDVIFGFTNDAFCFSQLHKFMYVCLRKRMPTLEIGNYTHFTNSMHVYERHFDMIRNIVTDGIDGYQHIEVPEPTYEEVADLVRNRGILSEHNKGAYGEWLFQT